MNAESPARRERLLELDPPRGPARAEYERALAELFERRLGGFERLRYVLLTAAGALAALGLGSLALTEPPETPVATRAILGVLAAMGATWFAVAWRVLRRGSVHLIADRRRIASIVLAFAVLQCAFMGWIAWRQAPESGAAATDVLGGLYLGLAALLLAAVVYVAQRVREAELRTREQVLRAALAQVRG